MGVESGVIVGPGTSLVTHGVGDTGFDNKTAGTKWVGIINNAEVVRISATEFSWKGATDSTVSMGRQTANVNTSGTTETTLMSLPALAIGQSIHFRVLVGGKQNDETEASTFSVTGCAVNAAGTTAILGTTSIVAVEDTASTDVVVDANDTLEQVRIRVVGISAETWQWAGAAEYIIIS